MIKKKILNRAKKTLSTEIKEIQNLSKIFNYCYLGCLGTPGSFFKGS